MAVSSLLQGKAPISHSLQGQRKRRGENLKYVKGNFSHDIKQRWKQSTAISLGSLTAVIAIVLDSNYLGLSGRTWGTEITASKEQPSRMPTEILLLQMLITQLGVQLAMDSIHPICHHLTNNVTTQPQWLWLELTIICRVRLLHRSLWRSWWVLQDSDETKQKTPVRS